MRSTRRYDVWLVPWMIVLGAALMASPAQAQTCAPRPPGMIAWWPGDGTGDDIVGYRNAVPQWSGGYDSGMVNQAFKCPYFYVADADAWTLGTEPFTIDLWVKFNSLAPNYGPNTRLPFISHDNGAGENPKWIFWYDDLGHADKAGFRALRFHINAWEDEGYWKSLDPVAAPWSPVVGIWYHVAVTRSGNEYKLYINGVLAQTDHDDHAIPDPSYYLTIGKAEQFNLNGLVDEVEVFDRALAATEIQRIYSAGSAGKCRGAMPVNIDIKPGSFPNSINVRSSGVIPVAILTTSDLDVLDVDAASCRFGPDGVESEPQQWALEDVDADGDMDLILHFPTPSGLVCGSTSAMLKGSLLEGQPIEGVDSVRTVGCK